MKAGEKVQDQATGAELIVVKVPSDDGLALEPGGGLLLGKRYTCASCGAEVLVSKAGEAQVTCHGAAMEVAGPKTLPASD
jgi:hypothetical protein